jgi:type 1 glutamine amidotransferase
LKKVLFFSKSSAFEHSVIRRTGDELSYAEQILQKLGPKYGIAFTFSKDGSLFTPEYLAQFDAYLFYTSGDLLARGKDGNPPMTPAGKQALLDAVKAGKGFVGTHAATMTFQSNETVDTDTNGPRPWRYQQLGDKADPFVQMIGAELLVHGTQQIGKIDVIDRSFPGFEWLGESFELMEEWYSMTNFAPDMHVLLRQDTSVMRDPHANGMDWPPAGWDTPYKRPPYPATWARLHGKGRVFYTSLGHREDVWASELFERILFGGITWAVGNADAVTTPNIEQATPGYRELPPVSKPVPGLPKGVSALPKSG